jgi:hypothetical protein
MEKMDKKKDSQNPLSVILIFILLLFPILYFFGGKPYS